MFEKIKKAVKTKEGKWIFLILLFSVLIYSVSETEAVIDENGIIQRKGYDEDESTLYITASIENVGTEDLQIDVKNRQYTEQQCENLYEACRDELITIVLNGNENFNNISGDLNLIANMEGYPFDISWDVENEEIMDESGKIIAHERGFTIIEMTVSYGKWKREESFEVFADAALSFTAEKVFDDLKKAVSREEEEKRADEYIELPTTVDGYKVTYSDKSSGRSPLIFLLPLVAAIAIICGSKSDRKKITEKRKEQIIGEYGTVVQKMVMYLSSGMSLRNVWIRIYEDSVSIQNNNPIYEEMGITVNEMKNGVLEEDAYAAFSKRIGIPAITRFTTLIAQNLKKGSTNLSILLSIEANDAFEERKRRAKIKGEQAGTKLLLPMMMLMVIVMIIVMLPAFWSM